MKIQQYEIDDEELARFWYSDDPAIVIANKLGIDDKILLNAWRAMKRSGQLPRGDRPHRDRVRDTFEANVDGRPKVGNYVDEDPLLTALMQGRR